MLIRDQLVQFTELIVSLLWPPSQKVGDITKLFVFFKIKVQITDLLILVYQFNLYKYIPRELRVGNGRRNSDRPENYNRP